jgi:hypothetical protein
MMKHVDAALRAVRNVTVAAVKVVFLGPDAAL